MARKKKEKKRYFPTDPRYGVKISPTPNDLKALGDRQMLNSHLLDCLLQRSAPPPIEETRFQVYLGSLGTRSYMESCNALVNVDRGPLAPSNWNRIQAKIKGIRSTFDHLFSDVMDDDATKTLIIPIVNALHFFVLVVQFNFECPELFLHFEYYDSLRRSSRGGPGIMQGTPAWLIVCEVRAFFFNFVLHDKNKFNYITPPTDDDLLNHMIGFHQCPGQYNDIDCGLFCIAVVLHLLDDKPVTEGTFNFNHCILLRSKLAAHFNRDNGAYEQTSQVVRDCFPQLKGTSILSSYGVEVVATVPVASKPSIEDTKKNDDDVILLSREDVEIDDETTNEAKTPPTILPESNIASSDTVTSNNDDNSTNAGDSKPSARPKGNHVASDATNDSQGCISSLTTSNEDTVFQDILRELNIVEFPTLDDVGPVVEAYEKKSGNRLSIRRSLIGEFRLYVCKEHVNCTFQIYIGRRRLDGAYVVKRNITNHTVERCEPRARDGRQWKKRRAGKLDDMIVQVVRTKKDRPTPADVIKTAASRDGEVITYMPAYRSLNNQSRAQLRQSSKNFELLPGYLEAMKQLNPDSVIGYSHDSEKSIKHVHVFPRFMNAALKFVRPVISLDAAHLKSIYKGTMYVASVLSGTNEVYPIGFMISAGNEDGETWTTMLNYLKEACPLISEQGFSDECDDGEIQHPFLFVSDRDKGLKLALRSVFPGNKETSCAKHIEANVCQKFGQECARYVMPIAKTFSFRYSNHLIDQVRMSKPHAADYIQNVDNDALWRSTSWLDEENPLPPRYGIVTSNTSECVNNMFAQARTVGWLEAVESIVDIMSTRISTCRAKHIDREPGEVVPRVAQILKRRWDAAASIAVVELVRGCGDFKVVEPSTVQDSDNDPHLPNMPLNAGQPNTIYIVKPELQWCTCGIWQDVLYPCRHGCAVFRKWKEKDFSYVLQNLVHPYYKFECVQQMYKNNIFPACIDNVKYDDTTRPPVVKKPQPGRPRSKRLRRRSEFLDPDESPITCSDCGQRGHNKRTCKNQVRT
jgi:hypothetical protein